MMMTNAATIAGIVSRVREIAGERRLRGLGIDCGVRIAAFPRPRLSAS
jgi:hypothetical protein